MAQGVYYADARYCSPNDRQHLPNELVKRGVMLLVDDVDWFYFCHKHRLLGCVVAECPTRTNRVPIVLAGRS
jgi:hypothetical protein